MKFSTFLRGHKLPVTCVCTPGKGDVTERLPSSAGLSDRTSLDRHVYTGGKDCCVIRWDLQEEKKTVFQGRRNDFHSGGHFQPVYGVCVAPDESFFCSVGKDQLVRIWDPRTSTSKYALTVEERQGGGGKKNKEGGGRASRMRRRCFCFSSLVFIWTEVVFACVSTLPSVSPSFSWCVFFFFSVMLTCVSLFSVGDVLLLRKLRHHGGAAWERTRSTRGGGGDGCWRDPYREESVSVCLCCICTRVHICIRVREEMHVSEEAY